jgi:predicted pyridoxine 5'-phosphate oxidase superfamily flavin-nucleotide-binding protein
LVVQHSATLSVTFGPLWESEIPIGLSDEVTSLPHLRRIIDTWAGAASTKDMDYLNQVARASIARSPYVVLSSVGQGGMHDISPRGDAPGFVEVVDQKTLIIPDRLGNHWLDTFDNLLFGPRLGLLFLSPGYKETLRLSDKGADRGGQRPESPSCGERQAA